MCAKEKVENVYKPMKAGEGLEAEIEPVGKKYHETAPPEMLNFSNGLRGSSLRNAYESQVRSLQFTLQRYYCWKSSSSSEKGVFLCSLLRDI